MAVLCQGQVSGKELAGELERFRGSDINEREGAFERKEMAAAEAGEDVAFERDRLVRGGFRGWLRAP